MTAVSIDRRTAVRTIAGGAVALGLDSGAARAAPDRRLELAADIGRRLAASMGPDARDRLDVARWRAALRGARSVDATLAEVRSAAARDFARGAVVALGGARLAHAEAAFALACREQARLGGRRA